MDEHSQKGSLDNKNSKRRQRQREKRKQRRKNGKLNTNAGSPCKNIKSNAAEAEAEAERDICAERWLKSRSEKEEWLSKFDLVDLLEKSDGLIRIENFLPQHVAEFALSSIKSLPDYRWTVRSDRDNPTKNTTQHNFFVASPEKSKESDPVTLLTDVIQNLLPGKRCVFSAGKYHEGDHITEHDDHAYTYHEMPDGSDIKPVFCSRDVAVIYYLTKDWKGSDGGILIDLQSGTHYTPQFNSLIAFMVPRFHEVTAVRSRKGRDPRYSIFGWFLSEGDMYKYVKDPESPRNSGSRNRKKRRIQK